jgi:uncharacterized repeat protein (TIGR02543 family)
MSRSLSFLGDATSYINVPNSEDLHLGTGDFTIEWFQYQTDSNPFPRIFQIGTYNDTGIVLGVSIEGGNFYYWTNTAANYVTSLNSTDYKNVWVHFAISRNSGTTRIFMNGISIFSIADTNDFNPINDLTIANENTRSNDAAFGGYLYYVSILKGTGLYTANFPVSYTYPVIYTILINADTSGNNITTIPLVPLDIIVYSVTYDGNTNDSGSVPVDSFSPYLYDALVNVLGNTNGLVKSGYTFAGWNTSADGLGTTYLPSDTFSITGNIILYAKWNSNPPQPSILRMSLYTNNSQVYYKPNSLSSGIGSVRNHRAKKYRT